MDFIWGVLALLFIHVLDGIFYKLLAAAYQIFLAVSRINIFATEGGMKVFSTVSTQLYTIIGIAMIFVFAYQLVLLIINPEGGNQKSPSKLFFDTVVSVFVVLVLPTIFPASIDVAPYSPNALAKVRIAPDIIPGLADGIMTFQNIFLLDIPNV